MSAHADDPAALTLPAGEVVRADSIASRALRQMLSSTCSIWPGLPSIDGTSSAVVSSSAMRGSMVRRHISSVRRTLRTRSIGARRA